MSSPPAPNITPCCGGTAEGGRAKFGEVAFVWGVEPPDGSGKASGCMPKDAIFEFNKQRSPIFSETFPIYLPRSSGGWVVTSSADDAITQNTFWINKHFTCRNVFEIFGFFTLSIDTLVGDAPFNALWTRTSYAPKSALNKKGGEHTQNLTGITRRVRLLAGQTRHVCSLAAYALFWRQVITQVCVIAHLFWKIMRQRTRLFWRLQRSGHDCAGGLLHQTPCFGCRPFDAAEEVPQRGIASKAAEYCCC